MHTHGVQYCVILHKLSCVCGQYLIIELSVLYPLQIYSGTTDEKRTTVPFIYNLKRKLEGCDEGVDIDVVDFPGVDDRDESVSDLTPLLLHLVQIVIFVVNYK